MTTAVNRAGRDLDVTVLLDVLTQSVTTTQISVHMDVTQVTGGVNVTSHVPVTVARHVIDTQVTV